MKKRIAIALGLVLLTTAVLAGVINMWRFQSWADGETHGRWTTMYTGYGRVTGTNRQVILEPQAAASPDVTHGALVHTTESYPDAGFRVTMRTEKQVRRGDPNVWEVGWVLWNFRDDEHFYAVALKPNGWEISKQDPAYPGNQRFMATGDDRTFPIGKDYRVEVRQDWPHMTVSVDGRQLATVVDDERPYRGGAVGLYTEDAKVRFRDLEVEENR